MGDKKYNTVATQQKNSRTKNREKSTAKTTENKNWLGLFILNAHKINAITQGERQIRIYTATARKWGD